MGKAGQKKRAKARRLAKEYSSTNHSESPQENAVRSHHAEENAKPSALVKTEIRTEVKYVHRSMCSYWWLVLTALLFTFALTVALCLRNVALQVSIREMQQKISGFGLDDFTNFSFFQNRTRGIFQGPDQPGPVMAKKGAVAKYPVIIIPGFVTSALELWEGHECASGSFRQRMWTHLSMATSLLTSSTCWLKHLSLNFTTGLDPNGIRLRAAKGLDAVDFFFVGYAVWAKPIEALAALGYDDNTMVAMPYDWRLSIPNMELRDGYFTRLRNQVESFTDLYNEKVLLAAHSWGDNVARAFLHWMDEIEPGWVESHVAVLVNVAGPTLGTPKAATALLSGEMKDTAQLGGLANLLGEQVLSKEDRTLLWRTWGSSIGMLPIGGPAIWGNGTWAPDDTPKIKAVGRSFGALLSVREADRSNATSMEWLKKRPTLDVNATMAYTIDDTIAEIIKDVGPTYLHHIRNWSAAGMPTNESAVNDAFCPLYCDEKATAGNPEKVDIKSPDGSLPSEKDKLLYHFGPPAYGGQPMYPKHRRRNSVRNIDPVTTPLPNAPSLRIYCCYGYGITTERAYHYTHYTKPAEGSAAAEEPLIKNRAVSQNQKSAGADWEINRQAHLVEQGIESGILSGDGDGTVPLLSLGAMCEGGWRTSKLNPHGVKIVTREYKNNALNVFQARDFRGGPEASAHVEVLGNKHFLEDLLKIAAGWHDQVPDSVGSDIHRIVGEIEGWDIKR